jgi:hypothetical protein
VSLLNARNIMAHPRLLFSSAVFAITASVLPAAADPSPRLELGAQFSTLRLTDFGSTTAGIGGRLSFNVSRRFAIDGEINFFPNDRAEIQTLPTLAPNLRVGYSRRRADAFIGPKVGLRNERVGVFVTVRPGFARLTDRGVNCLGSECALVLIAAPVYQTEFALNTGGVLEFYPSRRTVARIDLGTTIIRHRSAAPPCNDCTTGNFSSRLGVGFRF